MGADGADFVANLINNTGSPGEGIVVLILGVITLLFGALGVFNELHNSLNIILNVDEEQPKNFLQAVKKILIDRLLSFTMILGIGFLLLVSLVVTAELSATQETIRNAFPMSEFMLQVLNLVISFGVITVLFALIFKLLPDAKLSWRDVWIGAFITSLLFSWGRQQLVFILEIVQPLLLLVRRVPWSFFFCGFITPRKSCSSAQNSHKYMQTPMARRSFLNGRKRLPNLNRKDNRSYQHQLELQFQ